MGTRFNGFKVKNKTIIGLKSINGVRIEDDDIVKNKTIIGLKYEFGNRNIPLFVG